MIGFLPSASVPSVPARDGPRNYISHSAISTYMRCPLRYRFRYLDNLPEKTVSSSLIFGNAVHRAVEFHLTELMIGNEPPSIEALLGEYDAAWSGYAPEAVRFGKNENRDALLPVAHRVLSTFQTSTLAKPEGVILGIEEELRGPVVPGCPDLLGRLDIIVETPQALVVTDLKTSRSQWGPSQIEESAGQLLLYSELAKTLSPGKELKLQFAVLTKTREPGLHLHDVPADRHQVDRIKRVVQEAWKAIQAEVFYPIPTALNCGGCSFREPCRKWR